MSQRFGRLHYDRIIAPWVRAASGRLLATPVHSASSSDPLLKRLLGLASTDGEGAAKIAASEFQLVENRSPGPIVVEASRRLAASGKAKKLRRPARDVTRFLENRALAYGIDREPFRGVDARSQFGIERAFAAGNERFAKLAWGDPWWRQVARGPAAPTNDLTARPRSKSQDAAICDLLSEAEAEFEELRD
jgi:hypothetical protein